MRSFLNMGVSAGEGSYPPAAPTGLTDNEDMTIWIDTANPPWLGHPLVHLIFRPLLHCIWWKCNRSILARMISPNSLLLGEGGVRGNVLMQHMQISPGFFCISIAAPESGGDIISSLVPLNIKAPLLRSDPPALWGLCEKTPCSEMHVHIHT